MLEENPFSTRVAHSLDHRSVVHGIREKDTAWKLGTKSRERSVVSDIAGRKDKGCGLSMKICEFLFERKMHSTIACYITCTAGTVTILVEGTTFEIMISNGEEKKRKE